MGSDDEFGPDTETIRSWLAKRSTYAGDARVIGAARPGGAEPERSTPSTGAVPSGAIDERDIGRSILDALVEAPAPGHATATARETTTGEGRWQRSDRSVGASGTDVDFPVRSGVRHTMALILLGCVVATGIAAYLATREQTPATIGVAAILGFLTLVVWAVYASCTTTRLSIRRGKLNIERRGTTEVVDIGNRYTPLAMIGEPGDRRWTVLVERPGQPLLVITRSIVDPRLFTEVLYRLRPELRAPVVGTQ